jgi:tetratricopeptide (TPR) repeat protein
VRLTLIVALGLLALVIGIGAAHASPGADLERARRAYRAKDWQGAAEIANNLLYPNVVLGNREEAVEGYILLGAAKYEVGERDRARHEFEKALALDPQMSITTMMFSEGAVRLFDDTKADVQAQRARDAEAKRLAEAREKLEAYRKSLIVVEKRSYGVNFVPFGAGQFQNKQNIKGFLFAGSELATAGTSMTIFLYLAGKYGLSGKVPVTDGDRVRLLQQIEIGTGAAFFVIYAYGVFDALRHYKPTQQVQGDDSLLPPELRDLTNDKPADKPRPKKTSLLDRLHVGPVLVPNGAGLGISLEND